MYQIKNKKEYIQRFLILILFIGLGYSQVISQTNTEMSEARQAVNRMNQQFMQAWQAGNAAKVASLYTENATFLAPHVKTIQGRKAIEKYVQGALNAGLKRIKLETIEFNQFNDMAHERGRYTLYAANGSEVDHGKYMIIWKQQNGEWKIHWDMFNTSVPRKKKENR